MRIGRSHLYIFKFSSFIKLQSLPSLHLELKISATGACRTTLRRANMESLLICGLAQYFHELNKQLTTSTALKFLSVYE
jgi:hypothetical protein